MAIRNIYGEPYNATVEVPKKDNDLCMKYLLDNITKIYLFDNMNF